MLEILGRVQSALRTTSISNCEHCSVVHFILLSTLVLAKHIISQYMLRYILVTRIRPIIVMQQVHEGVNEIQR